MYSADELYGDEITSPLYRSQSFDNRKQIEYRGIKAIWTHVYQAYSFTFRGERYRAATEAQFKWDVDSLIRRAQPIPMNGADFHHFGEC